MSPVLAYFLITLASFLLTWVVRQIAIKKAILDQPNARSSHTVATPRGGGLAVVTVFYACLCMLVWGDIDFRLAMALLFGVPIALIGFLDDIFDLSAGIRLGVQIVSAVGALWFLEVPYLYWIFGLLFIVWFVNLFNFLDGIDGYVGTETLFLSLAGYLLFHDSVWLILGASVAGFLPYNWQRASIFMGDVGSTTIGFIVAVLILYESTTLQAMTIWAILTLPFWFDATYTLLRRLFNGERITQAHRKHLFQRAVRSGFSHRQVVLALLGVDLLLLAAVLLLGEALWGLLVVSFVIAVAFAYMIEQRHAFDV